MVVIPVNGVASLLFLAAGTISSTCIVTLSASPVSVVLPAKSVDLALKSTSPVEVVAVGHPIIASKSSSVIVIDTSDPNA